MPTQTSGAISLLDVQNNLGGSNPISLSEYYSADTGLPASGAISMSEMYGRPRPTQPVISGVTFSPTGGASTYTATVNLSSSGANGTLYYKQNTATGTPAATDSGWQTSSSFSQPASTVRYYWAMRYNPPYYNISGGWTRTAPSAAHILTQGTDSSTIFGYSTDSGGLGSISPNTLNGASIRATYYLYLNVKGNITHSFLVILNGNYAQNFFTSVSESSLGTKTTSSASYTYASNTNTSTWTWSLTAAPANWDGSGDLTVTYV